MAFTENPVRRGWRLALCLSLLIHAVLGFLLSRVPDRAALQAQTPYPEQSWYTDEDDHEEMKITLVGQPHPASSQPQGVPQSPTLHAGPENDPGGAPQAALINPAEIGRASCRERGSSWEGDGSV